MSLCIGVPFRDLGPIDMAALAAKTLAQDEQAWLEHDLRQRRFEVHHDTRAADRSNPERMATWGENYADGVLRA